MQGCCTRDRGSRSGSAGRGRGAVGARYLAWAAGATCLGVLKPHDLLLRRADESDEEPLDPPTHPSPREDLPMNRSNSASARWRLPRTSPAADSSSQTPAAGPAVFLLLLLLLLPAAPAEAQETQWIHIRVEEPNATRVSLNLPIGLVEAGLQIAEGHMTDAPGRWGVGEGGAKIAELRQLWQALHDVGDTDFLEVEDGDTHMRISRRDGRVLMQVEEGGETSVRFDTPSSVIDALLGGDEDRLDLRAAIRELARTGEHDVLDIRDGDTTVRIWVADRQGAAGGR
jgi:hypothetical protein